MKGEYNGSSVQLTFVTAAVVVRRTGRYTATKAWFPRITVTIAVAYFQFHVSASDSSDMLVLLPVSCQSKPASMNQKICALPVCWRGR